MGETLNTIRNRPRFKLWTSLTPEEFTEQLKIEREKGKETSKFTGKISSQESFVEVKTEDEPIWKPRLTLRAEVEPGEGTIIRGIFGPRPSIWTFFMFLYVCLGATFITFGCLYYSMYVANSRNDSDFSWVGIATMLSFLAIIVTYIAVKIAQHKAKGEMMQLREFAENIILKFEKENEEKD